MSCVARTVEQAIKRKPGTKEKEEFLATMYLPYVKGCTDKLGRLLRKRNINTMFSTTRKIASMFPKTVSEDGDLQGPGVYSIPCSCGQGYIGQTGRHVSTTLKEHRSHLKNHQFEKSAMAEHTANTGHNIEIENSKILIRDVRFWPRLYREEIEIHKNPENYNRDVGIKLPGVWKRYDTLQKSTTVSSRFSNYRVYKQRHDHPVSSFRSSEEESDMTLETSSSVNRRRGNQSGNRQTIDGSHGSLQTKLRNY